VVYVGVFYTQSGRAFCLFGVDVALAAAARGRFSFVNNTANIAH